MSEIKHHPVALIILDGWGYSDEREGNAIALAKIPTFSRLWNNYPHALLQASGEAVGVKWGEMGNSEVGHLNIGAGTVVYQNCSLIDQKIADKSFFKNEEFLGAINWAKKNNSSLHLMGLLSVGGVHSSLEHLVALLRLIKLEHCKQPVFIHAFTDGRDTDPVSSDMFIKKIDGVIKELGVGQIATVVGRYYAMDRDNHWERIQEAYDLLTQGKGTQFNTALDAVHFWHAKNITDEFITPSVVTKKKGFFGDKRVPIGLIKDNDAIIFYNFRGDRARQITKAFISDDFDNFERQVRPKNVFFACMMEYEKGLPIHVAFQPQSIECPLACVVSQNNLTQLHIAETEKYAHVTFFVNGGREKPYPGEDRIMVPSPRVATYDLQPEMSSQKITDKVLEALNQDKYDLFIINFANADMVGHTGILEASIKAVESIDQCLERIVSGFLKIDGKLLITADHGNVEETRNIRDQRADTEHSTNPVPCIIIESSEPQSADLIKSIGSGILADVAPTVLGMLGIKQPDNMTGYDLRK